MLDRTKYVGTGAAGINKAEVRQAMIDRADEAEFGVCTWLMRRMSQHGMPSPMHGRGGIGRDALD
jgi:hypothetical protein